MAAADTMPVRAEPIEEDACAGVALRDCVPAAVCWLCLGARPPPLALRQVFRILFQIFGGQKNGEYFAKYWAGSQYSDRPILFGILSGLGIPGADLGSKVQPCYSYPQFGLIR